MRPMRRRGVLELVATLHPPAPTVARSGGCASLDVHYGLGRPTTEVPKLAVQIAAAQNSQLCATLSANLRQRNWSLSITSCRGADWPRFAVDASRRSQPVSLSIKSFETSKSA